MHLKFVHINIFWRDETKMYHFKNMYSMNDVKTIVN